MERTTIDNRLENAAGYGEMRIGLYIWRKSIKRLKEEGLVVTEKFPSKRKGEFYCYVDWSEAGEGETKKILTRQIDSLGSQRKQKIENKQETLVVTRVFPYNIIKREA